MINLEKEAGKGYSLLEVKHALEQHKPKALFVVHGESSTGVFQNLEGLGELCHKNDALFCVDTVCTLCTVLFIWTNSAIKHILCVYVFVYIFSLSITHNALSLAL